jgi:hypothetical protein
MGAGLRGGFGRAFPKFPIPSWQIGRWRPGHAWDGAGGALPTRTARRANRLGPGPVRRPAGAKRRRFGAAREGSQGRYSDGCDPAGTPEHGIGLAPARNLRRPAAFQAGGGARCRAEEADLPGQSPWGRPAFGRIFPGAFFRAGLPLAGAARRAQDRPDLPGKIRRQASPDDGAEPARIRARAFAAPRGAGPDKCVLAQRQPHAFPLSRRALSACDLAAPGLGHAPPAARMGAEA